jgi:hypothetical protein
VPRVLRRLRRHLAAALPELGTGGVGPHGAAKYEFDPDNPSETEFPPYFDGAVLIRNALRNDTTSSGAPSGSGICRTRTT